MFVRRPNGSSSVSSDPGERYIRVPEHGLSNSSSLMSSTLQPDTAAAGGFPSVFPASSEVTSVRQSGEDDRESYIRLEDCYSGQPVGSSHTLPLFSVSHSRRSGSPDLASRPLHQSVPSNVDPANHLSRHRVEYCNEYELGEHRSMFASVNNNYNYCADAVAMSHCNDNDTDSDELDYCHYQYPTVCYSMSEVNGTRCVPGSYVREPPYVNCSDLLAPYKRVLWEQHSVDLGCHESPQLSCEESSFGRTLPLSDRDRCDVDTRHCPFYRVAGAGADDDDDTDVHDYVNVSSLHFHT